MNVKRIFTALLLISLCTFLSAEKTYYAVSPLTGGLPSSSIQKTADENNPPKMATVTYNQNKKTVYQTAIIICAITVTVFAVYGIYKMKTTDATCTEAYFDDCADSLYCDDNFCNSIGEDCTQDIVDSCAQSIVDSMVESCNTSEIAAFFTKGIKLIPIYVR